MKIPLLLGVYLAPLLPLAAQDEPQAFVGAEIHPIDGAMIEDGVLLVHRGKIRAVGSREDVRLPAATVRHDCRGMVILPGLVDSHSHIGGVSGGDRSAPLQPEVRALDSINVRDSGFRKALAGGITTVNIMPGSGHLLSGQTIYLKLRRGESIDELWIPDEKGRPMGGIKMANGTNSRRDPPFPGTRAKSAALVRQKFVEAQAYQRKLLLAEAGRIEAPERDLGLEALVGVLEGRTMVHHHTHRHDDILTVLRLKQEFGFRVTLHHVSDGWQVAEQIAAAGAPCSIIVIDSPGGKIEAKDLIFETGAALERAGALVGFHTDDGITDSRLFLRSAALAVRAGMSREKALEGLTIANAIMLDLQDRVGTLTPGKDADFILLTGDPLSVYTHVQETWIEGIKVFDRDDPEDRLFAVGGYGASQDQSWHLCCAEDHIE